MHIHRKMTQRLYTFGVTLDAIFYCPHRPEDGCSCRKPKPGLLLAIGKALQMSLVDAICIGDSLRDIQAAIKVNANPILVLTGNGKHTLMKLGNSKIPVYNTLADAAQAIISLA
jgi:D-glycero-D-manno-heptose 1,7-bisphosphate phosphatase